MDLDLGLAEAGAAWSGMGGVRDGWVGRFPAAPPRPSSRARVRFSLTFFLGTALALAGAFFTFAGALALATGFLDDEAGLAFFAWTALALAGCGEEMEA